MQSAFDDPSVAAATQAAVETHSFGQESAYDTSFWKSDNTNDNNNNTNINPNNISDSNYGTEAINNNSYANNNTYDANNAYSQPPPSMNNNNYNNNIIPNNDRSNSITDGVNNKMHNDLDLRESNLLRKEKELAERSARLNAHEEEILLSNYRADNWPSKCYPITFHSIQEEIPPFARPHMRKMYTLVLLTFLTLFWNLCTELAIYLCEAGDKDTDILWSTVYFAIGTFLAWKLWYRQIYYGLRDRKTLKWWIFYVFFIVHIGFSIYMAIGIENGLGAAGWVRFFDVIQNNGAAGLCNLVSAILWTIVSLASIFLIKRSWSLYRQRGGLEQARDELTNELTNAAVRQMANGGNQQNQTQNLV